MGFSDQLMVPPDSDPFIILPVELIQNILKFLPGDDLLRVSCVSRNFRSVINYVRLFRDLCQRTSNSETGEWTLECREKPSRLRLGQHLSESQTPDMDVNWKQIWIDLATIQKKHRDYIFSINGEGVYASSTDRDDQGLSNTLHAGSSFWSSVGTVSTTQNESITYKLVQPVCVVTAVEIFPFKAVFHHGLPTYGPQRVRISIGYRPDSMHYVSEILTCGNVSEAQVFNIAPDLVLGSYIHIELMGRRSIQPADGLYYIVIKQVKVYGIPLGVLEMPDLASVLLREATFQGCQELSDKDVDLALQQLELGCAERLEKRTIGKSMLTVFAEMFRNYQYREAAQYAGSHESGVVLRDLVEYAELLESPPNGAPNHLYYQSLSATGTLLNEIESFALVKESTRTRDFNLLRRYISQDEAQDTVSDMIICTERMGDFIATSAQAETNSLVRKEMLREAMRVYYHATTWDKMIDMALELCYFGVIMRFFHVDRYQMNWPEMVAQVVQRHKSRNLGLQFAAIIVQHPRVTPDVHEAMGLQLSVQTLTNESWRRAIHRENSVIRNTSTQH
eukprot:CFRG5460T1